MVLGSLHQIFEVSVWEGVIEQLPREKIKYLTQIRYTWMFVVIADIDTAN